MEIKDNNYYVVLSFMVKELHLKGIERDIYAIIYGFSQAEGRFTGSLQYLADWTCATKQGVLKAINRLLEKNLIAKNEYFKNNVKFIEYYVIEFNSIKLSLMGIKQSLPNNIEDNNTKNKDILHNNKLLNNKSLLEKNIKKSSDLLGKTKKLSNKEKLYNKLINEILVKSKLYQIEKIRDILIRWLNALLEINKLPSSNSLEDSLLDLEKYTDDEIIEAINNSIRAGYSRFYPKKIQKISADGINTERNLTDYEIKKMEESEKYIREKYGNNNK